MDLDKNWYRGGVAADVHSDLRTSENRLTSFFEYKVSKHLSSERRRIIDWMFEIIESLDKSGSTKQSRLGLVVDSNSRSLHLSVYLFDCCLNAYFVFPQHVCLVAVTSLIVAAKFEVQHSAVPTVKTMNEYLQRIVGRTYALQEFRKVECMILQCIDWRLHVPLSVDFLRYYERLFETFDNFMGSSSSTAIYPGPDVFVPSSNAVLHNYSLTTTATPIIGVYTPPPDEPSPSQISNSSEDWKCTAEFLINFSLKDLTFRQFKPSLITSAAIIAARYYHHLQPLWSKKSTEVSGYSLEILQPCVRLFSSAFAIEQQWKLLNCPLVLPPFFYAFEVPVAKIFNTAANGVIPTVIVSSTGSSSSSATSACRARNGKKRTHSPSPQPPSVAVAASNNASGTIRAIKILRINNEYVIKI